MVIVQIIGSLILDKQLNQRITEIGVLDKNTSGYVGVYKRGAKWCAQISVDSKNMHLGIYDTIEQAAQARKQAEIDYGYHKNHGRI
jgi:hypothetical protein